MTNKSTQYGQPNGNTPHKLTVEELRKGALNSAASKVQNRTFKEWLERMGSLAIQSDKDKAVLKKAGLTDDEMISDAKKMYMLNRRADAGDLKANEIVAKIRRQLTNVNINENHNLEYKPLIDLTERKKNGQK